MVLPYINMHPPSVYTCSPSWTLLPVPSPYHPNGHPSAPAPNFLLFILFNYLFIFFPKLPVSCIKPRLAIHFLYDIMHVLIWVHSNEVDETGAYYTEWSKPERKTPTQYAAKSLQSCPTLCDPIDSRPPGSTIPEILQAKYWSGLPFPSPMHESEKWNWSLSVTSNSWRPHGLQPNRLLRPWDFPGKSTRVGCHCLLHSILMHIYGI